MAIPIRALITSSGGPGAPAFIGQLSPDESFHFEIADAEHDSVSRLAFPHVAFHVLPKVTADGYLESLLEVCRSRDLSAVLPLSNFEAKALSRNKAQLVQSGIRPMVEDYSKFDLLDNKGNLYAALQDTGFVPPFQIVGNIAALSEAVFDFGYPKSKVVVKQLESSGSRGVRILSAQATGFQHFISTPPDNMEETLDTFLSNLSRIPAGYKLMVCKFLPGVEVTVDSVKARGWSRPLIFIRERTKKHGGLSVAGKFISCEPIEEFMDMLYQRFDLAGPVGAQFIMDVDGKFKLIEVNLRVQGTTSAIAALGLNFPRLIFDVSRDDFVARPIFGAIDKRFVRYWKEVYE